MCKKQSLIWLQRKAKGQELLDTICQSMNLLERDYFGLIYEDRYDRSTKLARSGQKDREIRKKYHHSSLVFIVYRISVIRTTYLRLQMNLGNLISR